MEIMFLLNKKVINLNANIYTYMLFFSIIVGNVAMCFVCGA